MLKDSMVIIHSILSNARQELLDKVTDPEIAPLRNRMAMELERNINFLALNIGTEPISNPTSTITDKPQPLKKIFGRTIGDKQGNASNATTEEKQVLADKPVQQNKVAKTPQEVEAEELRAKVIELFPQFLTIETDAILDTYSELEIRAVGKKAGLPVTENSPKKVDAKFVNSIKEAIKKKAELDKQGNAGNEGITGGDGGSQE